MATVPLLALAGLRPVAADVVTEPAPLSLAAFTSLAQPPPSLQVRYGAHPSQAVDVYLPRGSGPHPVVVLVHGGCWCALPGADRVQLRAMSQALMQYGVAVWSIGYRRVDEVGGGYPGTYHDVGNAIDRLVAEAPALKLDLSRVVFAGHSAGGHLAMWAARRRAIDPRHLLARTDALQPGGVVSIAGIGDLDAFDREIGQFCGADVLARLSPPAERAATSPTAMPASRVPHVMISGTLDRLVPPWLGYETAVAFRGHEAPVERVDIAGAGHFDLVHPGTDAGRQVLTRIARAVERTMGAESIDMQAAAR